MNQWVIVTDLIVIFSPGISESSSVAMFVVRYKSKLPGYKTRGFVYNGGHFQNSNSVLWFFNLSMNNPCSSE